MSRRSLTLIAPIFALALAASTGAASANCYADYKAKQNNPLRLQYGVIELPDAACGNRQAASAEIARRISRDGWTLLGILSIFGPDGLAQRKQDAGAYYLRY